MHAQHTPEELKALIAFMGPMYGQAKQIDGMITESCSQMTYSGDTIKEELERVVRASTPVAPPSPFTPAPISQYVPEHIPVATIVPTHYQPPTSISVDANLGNQMEFNFNLSEQTKTNDLLNSINRKLERISTSLEKIAEIAVQKNNKPRKYVRKTKLSEKPDKDIVRESGEYQ